MWYPCPKCKVGAIVGYSDVRPYAQGACSGCGKRDLHMKCTDCGVLTCPKCCVDNISKQYPEKSHV
jgi:hypothetical protein